ncbi:MAG TPA: alpha-amylase family protein [Micromonosporaceae bacterium]
MRLTHTADLWWKNAVVYCLDIETYQDSNGDGHGDIQGLIQRIDHLARLGVTCLWLMPFFPSPDRDDGYDITDFYNVDPRLGTLGDFVELMRIARDRGIRVIADLVVNHTSAEHPWFRSARSSRQSPYRDWYVWRDEPPADAPKDIVFPDQEKSVWDYDEQAGQYFLHRFYKHQPDLNITNPVVRDELARVMGFWLELGLSGFRVDAVPFLLETMGSDNAGNLPEPHDYLANLRAFLNRRCGDGVLLGEVNLPYPDTMTYFGDPEGVGDELTSCFDFILMQRMYLSLARRDAGPLGSALRERPEPPRDAQWATFVRNHDELTLDKLSEQERAEVFAAFGPEKHMQVYGRGLRRRLPTMLGGDERRIRMVYSLLFSLPGTPVLFYGEEIGLAENLDVEGRLAVRTPMQWEPEAHGGFSTADPDRLPAPFPAGNYRPERVNVERQRRDPDSMLSWTRMLIERYRECPELAWGSYQVLPTGVDSVFAIRCDTGDGTVVALHNLDDADVEVDLTLDGLDSSYTLIDLLGDRTTKVSGSGQVRLGLDGYGGRWLRARREGEIDGIGGQIRP